MSPILKAAILAFEMSIIYCFFIGIFVNSPINSKAYNQNQHYYINRGYPTPWAGVSAADKNVDFPIIKAPILPNVALEDGSKWTKLIDLRHFTPLFAASFLVSFVLAFPFAKSSQENPSFNYLLIPAYTLLALIAIFFYFFWFPRI